MTGSQTPDSARDAQVTPVALAALSQSLALVIVAGLVTIGMGVVLMVWPHETLVVVAVLFGISMIVIGLLRIFQAFGYGLSGGYRAALFLLGALTLLLGVVALRHLFASVAVLGLIIGVFWLIQGLFELFSGLTLPGPGRVWQIFGGIISVIAGVVVISYPSETLTILVWINGVMLVAYGVIIILAGLAARREIRRAGAQGPTVVDTTAS